MLASLAALLGAVVGCGSASQATATGSVTLDGKPIENGTISFVPADGQSATAGGRIENGQYSVELLPGAKRVEILATEVVGQRAAYEGDPNSPMIDITESIIPERYNRNSELTLDVQPGTNVQDFALDP